MSRRCSEYYIMTISNKGFRLSLPGMVTMGVPAQRTSMPVVWPLHSGVSRHTSASWPLLTCSSLGATGEKMMREPGRPMFWAYCWMLGSPTAGNRRSHSTLLGTRFRICRARFKASFSIRTRTFIFGFMCTVDGKKSKPSYHTYISPHLESRGVDLVQLVEVAVHNRVFWQAILGASRHNNCSWHFFPSGGFVVDLKCGTEQNCSEAERLRSCLYESLSVTALRLLVKTCCLESQIHIRHLTANTPCHHFPSPTGLCSHLTVIKTPYL